MSKKFKKSLILIVSICFMGCTMPKLFEVVIHQGNLVDSEMTEKLEVGMTESQVKYVMGTPLINDTFEPDRWDYFTSITQGNNVFRQSKITLFFDKGKLVKWEGNLPTEES